MSEKKSSVKRIVFRHFVAESTPDVSPLVGLKNKNTGRILYCYLGTLNEIINLCPEMFEIQRNTPAEGEDEEIFSKEIVAYTNKNNCSKKMLGTVKRYKNKVSVCVHQMFDETNSGIFKYSPCLVQFSPEDDLEVLRGFGQDMKKEHAEAVKTKLELVSEENQYEEKME